MNYTSISQSRKLLELGLNPKTSDMSYIPRGAIYNNMKLGYDVVVSKNATMDSIPCWSVGALLDIIPNIPDCTIIFAKAKDKYGMCITPLDSGLALNEVEADTPIEVVYNMVLWLLENNYIKKD